MKRLALILALWMSTPFLENSLNAVEPAKLAVAEQASIKEAESASLLDKVFDDKFLYKDGDGFLKSLRFLGRYHGQFISGSEQVVNATETGFHAYQHRRFRLGIEAKFAHNLTLYSELNIADGPGLTYKSFWNDHHDSYIKWEPSKKFWLLVGKTKQQLTREDTESSKKIKVLERAAIVNEVAGARPWGVLAGLTTGDFRHQLGFWLYGAHRQAPRWPDFNARTGLSYNLAYDLNDDVSLHFDYAYTNNNGGTVDSAGGAFQDYGSSYEHGFALGTAVNDGKFQLISDVIVGLNRETSAGRAGSATIPAGNDTWGFYVLPSYDLTENTEAVFRYAYMAEGREQNPEGNIGARQNLQNYHSVYLGFQHFIHGEKLKVMGGYEVVTGELFGTGRSIKDGVWQIGVRTYW
jgi:phosphate-selective porin OprO/OprP